MENSCGQSLRGGVSFDGSKAGVEDHSDPPPCHAMTRRHSLSLAICGLTLPGCDKREGSGSSPTLPHSAALEGGALAPVEVDPSFEIRHIAGLRPFRPSGFVVRRDEVGGKALIHNYGHGGGGISLSWGCADLAIRMSGSVSGKSCAVVGGGVMGLSTARLLLDRGAKVDLYASALPPDTTSNIAGAQWWPVSVFDQSKRSEAFGLQFVEAAEFSHRYFQNLVGPRWGVRWIPNYYLGDEEPSNGWMGGPGGVLHHLQIGLRDFGPGEHLFPARYVRRFHSMLIEPATYLETLLGEVRAAGGRIAIRHFGAAEEVLQLPHERVFNCSGLGARELFRDEELMPVKGQLSVLMPQPEIHYNLIAPGNFYMFPRSDGIVLGGTFERDQWDATPDPAVARHILESHRSIFDEMRRIQSAAL